MTNLQRTKFRAIHFEALQAGKAGANSVKIEPMVVAWKDANGNLKTESYDDGPCGFAWVNIKPANCRYAKYLLENKIASKDCYYKGVSIWVGDYNQSYEKKMAHAQAYVKSLLNNNCEELGIKEVRADGRLD